MSASPPSGLQSQCVRIQDAVGVRMGFQRPQGFHLHLSYMLHHKRGEQTADTVVMAQGSPVFFNALIRCRGRNLDAPQNYRNFEKELRL